jgi:hypothetical protein
MWMTAQGFHNNSVLEFDLPTMGTGTDPTAWPIAYPTRTIDPSFYKVLEIPQDDANSIYAMGIYYDKNNYFGHGAKFYISPRMYYDTAPPSSYHLYAEDGSSYLINQPRQMMSGFHIRDGAIPWCGAGGGESGQGFPAGITVGDITGTTAFLTWGLITSSYNFSDRQRRDANYQSATGAPPNVVTTNFDYWYSLDPVNHGGLGCWCLDRCFGNGILWPGDNKIRKSVLQGIGQISYGYQSVTFSQISQYSLYIIDPTDWSYTWNNALPADIPSGSVLGFDFGKTNDSWVALCNSAWGPGETYPPGPATDPVLVYYA